MHGEHGFDFLWMKLPTREHYLRSRIVGILESDSGSSPKPVSGWLPGGSNDPGIGWTSPTPLRGVLAIQPTLFRVEHVPVVDCAHGY